MMIMMVLVMMMNVQLRDPNFEAEIWPRKRRTAKAHVRYILIYTYIHTYIYFYMSNPNKTGTPTPAPPRLAWGGLERAGGASSNQGRPFCAGGVFGATAGNDALDMAIANGGH